MIIKIHSQSFSLSKALNDYTDSKVRMALSLFSDKIRRVDVFLSDINGPKGGEDMSCKLTVKADRCPTLVAHETADDMYTAISICSHRLKRIVCRRFDRNTRRRKALRGNVELVEDESLLVLTQVARG